METVTKRSHFRRFAVIMLAFVMSFLALSVTDGSVFAASGGKRVNISGIDATFKSTVQANARLGSDCNIWSLTTKGKARSIKLKWSGVSNPAAIDGYIIVRKDGKKSRWYQIAKVGKGKTSYKDKSASKKNKQYYYTVFAYKKSGGSSIVGEPAAWASAVTSRSSKKNVYKVTVKNLASVSAVTTGGAANISVEFPNKPKSTQMRWTSSNPGIAAVNDNGLITGVSHGVVNITGRTHTGNTVNFSCFVVVPGTADGIVEVMQSWMGFSRANGLHKGIIDIYNSMQPLPRGYTMKYSDEWCAACISAAAITSRTAQYTGRECSVGKFIDFYKPNGRWEEDGSITPRRGDLIIYGWNIDSWVTVFGNNYWASHIGVVESVSNNQITVIEGNMGTSYVGRRTVPVGWRFIRGYCRPNYAG